MKNGMEAARPPTPARQHRQPMNARSTEITLPAIGGLDAAEILARTRGSFWWAANYGLFVIAVAVHAAIGMRHLLREWCALRGTALAVISCGIFALLLLSGLRAVGAVVLL